MSSATARWKWSFPTSGKSRSFSTRGQFEMVAVDETTGNAFLVGRESRDMAWVDLKNNRVATSPGARRRRARKNLNQTPPPPIRKVVCDSAARIVARRRRLHRHPAPVRRRQSQAARNAPARPAAGRPLAFRRLFPEAAGDRPGGRDRGTQGHPGGEDHRWRTDRT